MASTNKRKMKERKDASISHSMERNRRLQAYNTHTEISEDPYMLVEKVTPKGQDLSKFLNKAQDNRTQYEVDQRGSTNTISALAKRNKLHLASKRSSKPWQSVASDTASNFSFHPEINNSMRWKPKYDDHYDHGLMVQRMHAESK